MTADQDADDALKSALRKTALARRDDLSLQSRQQIADAIAQQPPAFAFSPGAVVAGYCAIRSEIDAGPLMQRLARQGATLALPVIAGNDMPLVFREWRPGDVLQRGPFNILQPGDERRALVPDIILVPLAAFDRHGHRIGYGAGHYDRTLASYAGIDHAPVTVGIAAALQEVPRVPALPHDVPLAYIVTEHEWIVARSA